MTKIKGVVLFEDGSTEVREFDKGALLEGLYEAIGTDIVEAITLSDGSTAWLDEEGKLKERAYNVRATNVAFGGPFRDYIVGPLVVFGEMDEDGYDTDVREETLQWVTA